MGVRQNPAGDGSTDGEVRRVNAGVPDRSSSEVPQPGRRRMVRGAAAAVPTILTLHSGAALARSSNLISETNSPADDSYCLDKSNLDHLEGDLYDLGDGGSHTVWKMPKKTTYYTEKKQSQSGDWGQGGNEKKGKGGGDSLPKEEELAGDKLGREAACKYTGGDLHYKNGNKIKTWHREQNKPGILVSAIALSSFTGLGGGSKKSGKSVFMMLKDI